MLLPRLGTVYNSSAGPPAQWSWFLTMFLLSIPLHWGLLDMAKREKSDAAKLLSSRHACKLPFKSSW